MAIVQNPITGRTRKKFGTAVFSKQFEKNVMRTKPIDVKNPRTDAQVTQRTKFSATVELIRQVLPLINQAYDGSIKKMSPFNKIVSINVKNAFDGTPPTLNPNKVVLCEFDGSTIEDVRVTMEPDQMIALSWNANTQIAEELSSMVSFIIFNTRTHEAQIHKNVAARSEETTYIKAPINWVDDTITLHAITYDYSNLLNNKARMLIKFKPGADLAGKVR